MRKTISITILLGGSALAHAESLEDKKYWKGQTDYINKELESASKQCDVKFTFDWVAKDKFRAALEKSSYSPNGVCGNIIDQVEMLCREGDDEKAAVKAKIKAFKCGHAKPRTLDLNSGTLTYMGNNDEANFSDWAKPWLMKKL